MHAVIHIYNQIHFLCAYLTIPISVEVLMQMKNVERTSLTESDFVICSLELSSHVFMFQARFAVKFIQKQRSSNQRVQILVSLRGNCT